MPSDQSTWLLSIPQDGDSEGLLQEIQTKFSSKSLPTNGLAQLQIPAFKVRTHISAAKRDRDQTYLFLLRYI